jgi:hypothetical protein
LKLKSMKTDNKNTSMFENINKTIGMLLSEEKRSYT